MSAARTCGALGQPCLEAAGWPSRVCCKPLFLQSALRPQVSGSRRLRPQQPSLPYVGALQKGRRCCVAPAQASTDAEADLSADAQGGGFLSRPNTQSIAYTFLLLVAVGKGIIRVVAPERYVGMAFTSVPTPAALVQVVFSGASMYLLAFMLYTLKEAAEHGRLASATYQRLNVALVLHALVWAALDAAAWRAGLSSPTVLGVQLSYALAFAFICDKINRHTTSHSLWDSLTHLASAIPRGLLSLLRPANALSAAYAALTLGAGTAGLICLTINTRLMPLALSRHLPETLVGLELLFKRNVGNGLLTSAVALYTLKDAADRSRQDASTFRMLGQALALQAAICLAAMHWYRTHTAYMPPSGWTPAWQTLMFAMLAICGLGALRSSWVKRVK